MASPERSPAERLAVLEGGKPSEDVDLARCDEAVVGDLTIPNWGCLQSEFSDIQLTRSGIKCRIQISHDEQLLGYTVDYVEKHEVRRYLANGVATALGFDKGRAQTIKARLDVACSRLWAVWVRSEGLEDADVVDLMAQPDPEPDWVMPGLMERRERMILVAAEGAGKSTLLRQIAVQAAAGIHPFTLAPADPVRVLLVDAENSQAHVRRQLRPLTISARPRLQPGFLRVAVGFAPLDLLSSADAARLEERAEAHETALLVIGPNYKLASGDPLTEETARAVTGVLDRIRHRVGCAVLIESHMPHASNGSRRPWRPYGASLWMRWPEYGLYIDPDGRLRHWRGAREEREWPKVLKRGGAWPWTTGDKMEELGSDQELEDVIRKHIEQGGSPSARACFDAVRDAGLRGSNERINRVRGSILDSVPRSAAFPDRSGNTASAGAAGVPSGTGGPLGAPLTRNTPHGEGEEGQAKP